MLPSGTLHSSCSENWAPYIFLRAMILDYWLQNYFFLKVKELKIQNQHCFNWTKSKLK